MSTTLSNARTSDPVQSLDAIRPRPAKASLPTSDPVGLSDRIGPAFIAVLSDAIVRHYGSVKATAISLGDVDPSLLMREFRAGKFGRLAQADDQTKAAIATALHDAFGSSDPKAIARRELREIRQRLDHVEELIA